MPRPRTKPYKNNPELAEMTVPERVLFCSREMFQQKGFDGVNIRDILQAADVTQSVIYYHYTNKDGLFLAVIMDIVTEIDEFFKEAARETLFQNQLKLIARAFTQQPAPNLLLLIKDLNNRVKVNSEIATQGIPQLEARKALVFVNQVWPRALENMLRDARKTGQLTASNPSFLAHYILTLLASWSHSPFNNLTQNNPENSITTLLDFIFSNLKTLDVTAQI